MLKDLYCAHCGQKADPGKINFAFLCRELFHFVTHADSGFIYNSLQMIAHPGQTAKNYIDGERKRYQSPISYFLIWTTVFILFLYLIEKIFGNNAVINYGDYFGPAADTRLAISNLGIVLTVVIPFQALYLFLLVTKSSYNYFETMVATIYSIGTIVQFQFLFAFLAVISHIVHSGTVDLLISDSFKILYLIWFILDTIRLYSVKYKHIRAIGFMALAFGTFTLWRLYGFPVIMKILF
jgi:hypothetical protein